MKIMFLNKAYAARNYLDINPCKRCIYNSLNCLHIPERICALYGGFQNTNEEIFTL